LRNQLNFVAMGRFEKGEATAFEHPELLAEIVRKYRVAFGKSCNDKRSRNKSAFVVAQSAVSPINLLWTRPPAAR
jgi:hypothetical protein